jgi:hypothetical protein
MWVCQTSVFIVHTVWRACDGLRPAQLLKGPKNESLSSSLVYPEFTDEQAQLHPPWRSTSQVTLWGRRVGEGSSPARYGGRESSSRRQGSKARRPGEFPTAARRAMRGGRDSSAWRPGAKCGGRDSSARRPGATRGRRDSSVRRPRATCGGRDSSMQRPGELRASPGNDARWPQQLRMATGEGCTAARRALRGGGGATRGRRDGGGERHMRTW